MSIVCLDKFWYSTNTNSRNSFSVMIRNLHSASMYIINLFWSIWLTSVKVLQYLPQNQTFPTLLFIFLKAFERNLRRRHLFRFFWNEMVMRAPLKKRSFSCIRFHIHCGKWNVQFYRLFRITPQWAGVRFTWILLLATLKKIKCAKTGSLEWYKTGLANSTEFYIIK